MGDLNLIPADRLFRKRVKARMRLWAGVCSSLLLIIAVAVTSTDYCLKGKAGVPEHELAAVDLSIQEYNATAVELNKEISRATWELEVARVTGIGPDWGKFLALLAEELGEEVVLSGCQLTVLKTENMQTEEAAEPTDKTDVPVKPSRPEQHYELRLSGISRNQMSTSNLLLRLEAMDLFESVRLVSSNRQTFQEAHAVVFTVVCKI